MSSELLGECQNSVDPDRMLHSVYLIWVYTVPSGLSVQILRVNMDQTVNSLESDLGLHCLIRPVCLNTQGKLKYGT